MLLDSGSFYARIFEMICRFGLLVVNCARNGFGSPENGIGYVANSKHYGLLSLPGVRETLVHDGQHLVEIQRTRVTSLLAWNLESGIMVPSVAVIVSVGMAKSRRNQMASIMLFVQSGLTSLAPQEANIADTI